MGFDLEGLRRAVGRHGPVTRILIVDVKGSSPRDEGTSMLVWLTGQSGTIGGGALEFQVAAEARRRLGEANHAPRFLRYGLGPELGQCCGGNVALVCETYDAQAVEKLAGRAVHVRPVLGTEKPHPAVDRIAGQMQRNPGAYAGFAMAFGWVVEPVNAASRPVWVWGAGHVGRAVVATLAPLPDFDITWVDTARDRYPDDIPAQVTILAAREPERLVVHAPLGAEHLILTYSHALDLDLCHRLLGHDFAFAGLIGSATKWARFRSRLAALGHAPDRIARIACPIGDPGLGKHPQAIAVGVAAALLRPAARQSNRKDRTA